MADYFILHDLAETGIVVDAVLDPLAVRIRDVVVLHFGSEV